MREGKERVHETEKAGYEESVLNCCRGEKEAKRGTEPVLNDAAAKKEETR